jgi:hypothetical protein
VCFSQGCTCSSGYESVEIILFKLLAPDPQIAI